LLAADEALIAGSVTVTGTLIGCTEERHHVSKRLRLQDCIVKYLHDTKAVGCSREEVRSETNLEDSVY